VSAGRAGLASTTRAHVGALDRLVGSLGEPIPDHDDVADATISVARDGVPDRGSAMLFFDGALGLVVLALWVFCVIDVITTDESLCRNMPKTWWVLVVILLLDLGAVLWLVAGRPWQATSGTAPLPYRGGRGPVGAAYPEYDRPGRFAATRPEDDEEFLRQVRERAEEQRRRYREQQRRTEES
jgi:phospholipase D-like protein